MFRFKYYRKLKGSIAIYILVWGMILLSLALLSFSLECERRKNVLYLEKQVELNPISNIYREYLFSSFVCELKDSISHMSQENIDIFITDNYETFALPKSTDTTELKNKCKLYMKEDKNIIVTYIDEDGNKKFECYKIKVVNGIIKFCIIQDGLLPYGNNL